MEIRYNLLTQKLLSEGYTADNYPDYVRLPGGCWGNSPLQNLHDGFVYTYNHRKNMVFRTGCGILVMGSYFDRGSMFFMGITWIPENDNPTITCPYRKEDCNLRNPVLSGQIGGGIAKISLCDCKQTDEPYNYEKSYENILNELSIEKKQKYDEFVQRKGGHVCQWHTNYNEWTGEWTQNYDPMKCAIYCKNIGKNCDLTHKHISRKRGNVFYDVKTSYIRRDGTLFDGEEVVEIKKGVRLFKTATSMTICEAAARRKQNIHEMQAMNNFIKKNLMGIKTEVLNIRAEQRESRDLMKDLQDIKEGIKITHASDLEKQMKAEKKERREKAQRKRIERLEKKILEIGYWNLEQYSLDRIHADKWLGKDRIEELEQLRKQKLKEEQEKPVQLSILDII